MSDAASSAGRRAFRYWRNPIAVWAVLLGVLVHLAGFFAFSIDIPPNNQVTVPPPDLIYTSGDGPLNELIQEQSALLDFEPLFLPTEHNASVYLEMSDLVERTEPFSRLPPRLLVSEENFQSPQRAMPAPLEQPEEMLERDTAGSFGAFGQLSSTQEALNPRSGSIEIYRDGAIQPIAIEQLQISVVEEAVNNLSGILEWRVAVGEIGLVGQPLLIRGSGLESVDAAAATFLLEAAPQWGLTPGYYRVVMGP